MLARWREPSAEEGAAWLGFEEVEEVPVGLLDGWSSTSRRNCWLFMAFIFHFA